MLLKEILLDANLLVPNSVSDELKVGWLNTVQRQLYRDFTFPNTSRDFPLVQGMNLYALPADCSRERITSIIVDEVYYEYRTLDQDVAAHCWTIVDGKLLLYPTPTSDGVAYLNYRPAPRDMTIAMQDEKPDFPEDFHEVLVYGIAIRIARAQQNGNLAMELKANFDELSRSAERELRPMRSKTVHMNRTWR